MLHNNTDMYTHCTNRLGAKYTDCQLWNFTTHIIYKLQIATHETKTTMSAVKYTSTKDLCIFMQVTTVWNDRMHVISIKWQTNVCVV